MSTSRPLRQCDLAIVGGGLVGASLAVAASRAGFDTVLIEAVPFRSDSQPSYDDRTLALNHASCRILKALGLWRSLSANATPIREIIVCDHGRPGRVVLKPSEVGREWFGQVVEARVFGATVISELERAGSVDILCPARVTGVALGDKSATLDLDEAAPVARVEARLVVAADGAGSFVRGALGIEAQRHDYGQTAVICNVTPEQPHRGRAFERLTPTGPFAVLPHQGDRCGLVWTVPTDEAPGLLVQDEAEFLNAAGERFGHELGAFVKLGRRSSYPLARVVAARDTAQRAVVLGNAAHTIHPVGAQGFNLGLRDVATLAELLAERRGQDPGEENLLARYAAWRREDQAGTIGYSDGLARMWSNPSLLAGLARSAGFMAHAMIPPLRRQLMLRAMGYRGRVPAMALGADEV